MRLNANRSPLGRIPQQIRRSCPKNVSAGRTIWRANPTCVDELQHQAGLRILGASDPERSRRLLLNS